MNVLVWQKVALRKESVDRKIIYLLTASAFLMSLSARRAWIENSANALPITSPTVALRKESVDRKIVTRGLLQQLIDVALRKESVDRKLMSLDVLAVSAVALRKESVDRKC